MALLLGYIHSDQQRDLYVSSWFDQNLYCSYLLQSFTMIILTNLLIIGVFTLLLCPVHSLSLGHCSPSYLVVYPVGRVVFYLVDEFFGFYQVIVSLLLSLKKVYYSSTFRYYATDPFYKIIFLILH